MAFQVRDAVNRRIGRHQDRNAPGLAAAYGDDTQWRATRGRGQYRRITGRAQVHRASAQSFEQRRGALEVGPFNLVVDAFQGVGRFYHCAQTLGLIAQDQGHAG